MKERRTVFDARTSHGKEGRITDTSRTAQRRRIADFLCRHGRATTIQLRGLCNALHPAGRVLELRRAGWRIDLIWTVDHDDHGRQHRVGLYVLQRAGGGV